MSTTGASTSNKGSFKCVLCNNTFSGKDQLQDHFRSHASKPKIKNKRMTIHCDVCGEKFTNNTSAIQHKFRKHPNSNEKFNCPTCGMAFPLKALLDRHIPIHSQGIDLLREKTDSPCDVCGAKFENKHALRYHYTTNHQRVMKLFQPIVTAPPSKKIKVNNAGDVQSVYFCHICGSEYIVKFNLQKHLENSHTQEERLATPTEMIRCTACDALFYNRKAYENHNIGHKPDDLYAMDEQQRLQLVSRVDQDYDARRVLPVADKFVPSFRNSKRNKNSLSNSQKKEVDDESLSPPSSPDSSDSEAEATLLNNKNKKKRKPARSVEKDASVDAQ